MSWPDLSKHGAIQAAARFAAVRLLAPLLDAFAWSDEAARRSFRRKLRWAGYEEAGIDWIEREADRQVAAELAKRS